MNKKIYLLLPFCLTLLPACTKSYTLTLVNSNKKAGTIITQNGKYKAGENVHIVVEPIQGYKVEKWKDSSGTKVGSRSDFNFCMPSQDTTLTVYYEYADFELSFDYTITSDEDHYSFSNAKTLDPTFAPDVYFLATGDEGGEARTLYSVVEYTWQDSVTLWNFNFLTNDQFSLSSITDEDGELLGETSCFFEMPNHNKKITLNFISKSYGALVTCNIPNIYLHLPSTYYSSFWNSMADSYFQRQFYTPDTCTDAYIQYDSCYSYNDGLLTPTSDYVFDHWLDLDTQQTITTNTILNIDSLSGSHRYQCVLREA